LCRPRASFRFQHREAHVSALAEAKRAARAAAFERRAAAHESTSGAARQAASHILDDVNRHRGVAIVAGYLPIRTEIDPVPAMLALLGLGHRVCVPVIVGRGEALRFREWQPGCTLVAGPLGLMTPEDGHWLSPDYLIVPLVAFDAACHRLGYGGGFYDRTLATLRAEKPVRAVGLAYAAQRVGSLPLEASDVQLDGVATETGLHLPARSDPVLRPNAGGGR
jgi:5-formyltetrahydrofolate cyclo-ligase